MSKNITIKDIAKELNMHHTTVSMALRNKKGIKEETRTKIWEKARQLGYRTNLLAQSFRNKRSQSIGILVPNIHHHFFSRFISEISELANNNGYSVMVFQSNEKREIELQNLEALADHRAAGIIASVSIETTDASHFHFLQQENIPLVFFDRVPAQFQAPAVSTDNFQGAFDAVSLLASSGRKKIAFITGHSHINVYHDRLQGYLAALRQFGLPIREELLIQGGFQMEDGMSGAEKLLQLSDKPNAILAVGDDVAIGAIKFLKNNQVRIPEDIAVIGFDNDPMGIAIEPELTTVNQPLKLIAQRAFDLLGLSKPDSLRHANLELIPASIIQRKSN